MIPSEDPGLTYPEALRFLYGLRRSGVKLGLETPRSLARMAGNPETRLRFVHVAGTNGKGSTCAMLEAMYRAAGLRTGLFTSPHLVSFRERIQVERRLIAAQEVARLVGNLRPWVESFPAAAAPTVFEAITLLGLLYFVEQRCDVVIWETGLGGRLDATNIVTPLASVITHIALDHQEWLGATLPAIAAEKAGIIKPGIPVLTTCDEPEVLEVLRRRAEEVAAPLTLVRPAEAEGILERCAGLEPGGAVGGLALEGPHQVVNAALAVSTVEALQPQLACPPGARRHGLAGVRWPGRFQVHLCAREGLTVVLDGAHNPDGARVLAAALGARFPGRKPMLVLGVLADKDTRGICEALAPVAGRILLVPVSSARALPPAQLLEICGAANPGVPIVACAGLPEALRLCPRDSLVVIAGSLYLMGEAMEYFDLGEPGAEGERALNDWTPTRPGHELENYTRQR